LVYCKPLGLCHD